MMSRRIQLVVLVILLLATGALPFSQVLAQGPAARLVPAFQNINVGQVATVGLQVENVELLYGYQAAVVFDPAILEVVDADTNQAGVQIALGNFIQPNFVQGNSANNSTGAIIVVVSQLAPANPVSGTGTLFTITFRGKANGTSAVHFTDLRLARSDGNEISVTRQDAQVAVGTQTGPTATFTATATPTPTSTVVTPTPTTTPATATPTSTPTMVPGQTILYVVQTGDTLYSIARRFGVTVDAIVQLNHLPNPRYIRVGQQLLIPRGGTVTPVPVTVTVTPAPGPTTYVVQRGDTLYSIARRYGTTVEAIALANHIANPSRIYVGQVLTISGGSPTPPPTRTYVVQAGDTLYSIARRYGTTYWAIVMANNLANPNVIYVGQQLVIP